MCRVKWARARQTENEIMRQMRTDGTEDKGQNPFSEVPQLKKYPLK